MSLSSSAAWQHRSSNAVIAAFSERSTNGRREVDEHRTGGGAVVPVSRYLLCYVPYTSSYLLRPATTQAGRCTAHFTAHSWKTHLELRCLTPGPSDGQSVQAAQREPKGQTQTSYPLFGLSCRRLQSRYSEVLPDGTNGSLARRRCLIPSSPHGDSQRDPQHRGVPLKTRL